MNLPTPPDPNLVYGWLALASLVGSWLVAKVRGKKTDNVEALLKTTIAAELEHALRDRVTYTAARAMMETACYSAASAIGVKPQVARPFVEFAVEHGMAELRRRVATMIETDLAKLATVAKTTAGLFEAKDK